MGTIVDKEPRINYMKYVRKHLREHPDVIAKKGFNSLNDLKEEPTRFKKFIIPRNDSTYKSVKEAFLNEKRAATPTTLGIIHKIFEIPFSYDTFLRENKQFKLFYKIDKSISKATNADKFYNGHPPDWSDLAADFDFPRTCYTDKGGIRQTIFSIVQGLDEIKFYFLTGVAGTGKTCILKRLAFDLSSKLSNVYYFDTDVDLYSDVRDIYNEISAIINYTESKIVFVLNGCYRLIKPFDHLQLSNIVEQFYKKPILFIIAENNTNYNNLVKLKTFAPGYLIINYPLKQLDDLEIEQIFTRIKYLEGTKKLTKIKRQLTISETIELCKTKFGKHLLVVFLQVRMGKRFIDIIKDECENLRAVDETKFSFSAYIIVCLFSKLGVDTPLGLLFYYLNRTTWEGEDEIERNCSEIILKIKRYYRPRHPIIGEEVFNLYLKGKGDRIISLIKDFLDVNNLKIEDQVAAFAYKIFQIRNLHLRLFEFSNDDEEVTREFYEYFSDFPMIKFDLRRRYYISYGLFERLSQNFEASISLFNKILGRKDPFVFRMLSYNYLSLENWKQSGEFALRAYEFTVKEETKLEIAIVLSLNRLDYFLKAREIFNSLKDSDDSDIKKQSLKYFNCLDEISRLEISHDEEINKFLLSTIRPKLIHFSSFKENEADNSKVHLFELLLHQQDYFTANIDDLKHIRVLFDKLEDTYLKGLFYRMFAKSVEMKLRHMEIYSRSDEVDALYKKSLQFNELDSFAHYYYADFLKDFKNDYIGAEKEYRKAIDIADNSNYTEYHRHPKLLNGLAMLYIELLERDHDLTTDQLMYTAELLDKAVDEVKKRNMDFKSPENNIRWLLDYIKRIKFS